MPTPDFETLRLADLMIKHNVGGPTTQVCELQEVSNEFSDEDEG